MLERALILVFVFFFFAFVVSPLLNRYLIRRPPMQSYLIHYDQSFRVQATSEEEALEAAWSASKLTNDQLPPHVERVWEDTQVEEDHP